MKCPKCNSELVIINNRMESDINSTDVYSVQTLACTNRRCELFVGDDLRNPLKIAHTTRKKVN